LLREPVVLYLFSGSGNTHAVAGRVVKTLLEEGIAAQLRPLERSDPGYTIPAGTVGLAFPVALFSTYPFVWEFAENLAPGRGKGIFMVDTLAGFSGGVVGPMKRVVSARGYHPVGAVEIRMPSNYARTEQEGPKDDRLRRRGLKKAAAFARNLVAGRTSWRSIPLLPELIKRLGRSPQGRAWAALRGKYPLSVDVEKCARCGLCAEVCPVSNITMEAFPRFGEGCLFCQRCVSLCPREAIGVKGRPFVPYRGSPRREMLELAGVSLDYYQY
jgi:ferredoxin